MKQDKYVFRLLSAMLIAIAVTVGGKAAAKTLTIAGTGDSQDILRILGAAFGRHEPESRIIIPDSVGSGGGIMLLKKGRTGLARTARPLKKKERPGLIPHIFAVSPVVFAANPESDTIKNLDKDQIEALYGGRIVNWQALDHKNDHRIYLLQRERGDSSRRAIAGTISLLAKNSPTAKIIYSTPETATTLRDIPWTLGYLPLSMAVSHKLKVLNYQDMAPTAPDYPMQTPFYLVSRGTPRGLAARFIKFLHSAAAAAIMHKNGVIPR